MEKQKRTPDKLLLNVYHFNRQRLDRIQGKLRGTLTAWINTAIKERLEREHPEVFRAPEEPEMSTMVSAPPRQPLERMPVDAPTAKLLEDQEDDFWSDAGYERTKAALARLRR